MADVATQPVAKHPGDRLASYFENFFKTIVGIATLGASITFAKIVQSPVAPFADYGFSVREVQYLLATSWLLFVITLAFASFFASALSLWRPQAVAAFGTTTGKERVKVLWVASAVSALLYGLAIAAFLTLALVVVAYVGSVGWVAVAFTVVFAVLGFGSILWQSPLEWPRWLLVLHERSMMLRRKISRKVRVQAEGDRMTMTQGGTREWDQHGVVHREDMTDFVTSVAPPAATMLGVIGVRVEKMMDTMRIATVKPVQSCLTFTNLENMVSGK